MFTFPKQRTNTKPQEEPTDVPKEEPVTISKAMYAVLATLCKQKGKNAKEIINAYGVEKPSEMLVTVWQKAVADLKELPDAQ